MGVYLGMIVSKFGFAILIPAAPYSVSQRVVGRPREFDLEVALDKAIVVFTERGYHAASIGELSAAMGVTPGSLYKAFADKKAIFLACFDRYKQVRNALLDAAIGSGRDGRDRIRQAVHFYADAAHGQTGRRGCLVVGAAVELALFDSETEARVARSQAVLETRFESLVREGQADGSIASHVDPSIAARVIYAVVQGLRIIGKTGQERDRAMATADAALKILD